MLKDGRDFWNFKLDSVQGVMDHFQNTTKMIRKKMTLDKVDFLEITWPKCEGNPSYNYEVPVKETETSVSVLKSS
jgi:cephalosporin-C deacetylase-like acetyl esterase